MLIKEEQFYIVACGLNSEYICIYIRKIKVESCIPQFLNNNSNIGKVTTNEMRAKYEMLGHVCE